MRYLFLNVGSVIRTSLVVFTEELQTSILVNGLQIRWALQTASTGYCRELSLLGFRSKHF